MTDFHYGVLGGFNSIVNLEKSSIINGRGSALRLANPKIFKVQNCIYQKIVDITIDLRLVETPQTLINIDYLAKVVPIKLNVSNTRFISLDGPAINVT